jgi:hypothetical protein
MSKLVKPREAAQRKLSQHKDSEAKRAEVNILADKLISSPEYKWLKLICVDIAKEYRTAPGTTPDEDYSYQIHCKAIYFYNKMFQKVESYAKQQKRRAEQYTSTDW